jgi:hypothetical protein
MARRRTRKTANAIAWYLLAIFLITVIAVGETIYHALGYIIVTIVISSLAYCAGRYGITSKVTRKLNANARYGKTTKTTRPVKTRSAFPVELRALNDEIQRLRRELETSRESERAAWDATTGPATPTEPDNRSGARDAIINTPMSGVRPLLRGDETE